MSDDQMDLFGGVAETPKPKRNRNLSADRFQYVHVPGEQTHRVEARQGKKTVGYVEWKPDRRSIDMVQVDPDKRRRGIGTRLAHEALLHGASWEGSIAVSPEGASLRRRTGGRGTML